MGRKVIGIEGMAHFQMKKSKTHDWFCTWSRFETEIKGTGKWSTTGVFLLTPIQCDTNFRGSWQLSSTF